MTTRTDADSVAILQQQFKPAQKNIISDIEATFIRDTLEIKDRTNIELQNICDFTVLSYGHNAATAIQNSNIGRMMSIMDESSAICTVIDQEKVKRGMPV